MEHQPSKDEVEFCGHGRSSTLSSSSKFTLMISSGARLVALSIAYRPPLISDRYVMICFPMFPIQTPKKTSRGCCQNQPESQSAALIDWLALLRSRKSRNHNCLLTRVKNGHNMTIIFYPCVSRV